MERIVSDEFLVVSSIANSIAKVQHLGDAVTDGRSILVRDPDGL